MQTPFSKQIPVKIFVMYPDKNEAIDFHALYAGFLAVKMSSYDKNLLKHGRNSPSVIFCTFTFTAFIVRVCRLVSNCL